MHFMKRTLLLLCVAFLIFPAMAQNTLTIYQKDGQQFSFGFAEKPVITYTDNDLVLKTSKTEVSYPLSTISKFTFSDSETHVSDVVTDIKTPALSFEDYMVNITGAESDVTVSVIGSDGKIICSYKTDTEGCVTFSIAELPEGVYIIKSEKLTCKILKR